MLTLVLLFSLLGSIGALAGAGILLAFPTLHDRLKSPLLAYAVGTLLGATFLGLIPEAIEQGNARTVLLMTLVGFLFFFALEKILRLPHVHGTAGMHPMRHPAGTMILWGDAFHNFVDGVVIATAFSVSTALGIVTALAVVAHEIPQELGDFVILMESGWEPLHAFWLNFLSALATIPGAVLALVCMAYISPLIPFLLALAASSFLYIAATDLAPILHHETDIKRSIKQFFGIILGIGTIAALHTILAWALS